MENQKIKERLNNIIAFIIFIGFIFGLFIGIERLVWANTDFVLFENNIKLNTNNDDWMKQVQCTNAWFILKKENITKYRCGDLFPNTINFIQKNLELN